MRRSVAIIGVILGMVCAIEHDAAAQWGPGQISVQGDLANLAGAPVGGPVNLAFSLYPAFTGDVSVWTENHPGVVLVQGAFDLILGETSPLDDPPLFEIYPDLWIGVSVDGGVELPRVPLAAVGYSMQAKHAAVADSLSQPPSELDCVGCVGTVELEDGGVALQDLDGGGCAGSSVLKRNPENTAWVCVVEDLAAIATSGHFDDLLGVPGDLADGDDDSLAGMSCMDGMILRRSGGVWGCALPLIEAEVDAAVANNGYVTVADLSTVAMSGAFSDLIGVPDGIADGDDVGLTGAGAAGELGRFVDDGSLAGAAVFQDQSNRVGVGTTAPAVRLDVAGEVRISSTGIPCTPEIEGSIRYDANEKVFEGCDGVSWKPLSWFDSTPDAYDFVDITDATLNSSISSNIVQLTGFSNSLSTSVSGEGAPEMRICGDGSCAAVLTPWTPDPVTLLSGQFLQLRLTSATQAETSRTATVTVGEVQDIWTVTTDVLSWRIGTWNGQPVYGTPTCASGDYYCQAKSACEQATGATCVWQEYNCTSYPNENGSFYPTSNPLGRSVSTSGSSSLNWAVTSACAQTGDGCVHGSGSVYGNLCCCNCNSTNQQWNEGNDYCGVGIWEPY